MICKLHLQKKIKNEYNVPFAHSRRSLFTQEITHINRGCFCLNSPGILLFFGPVGQGGEGGPEDQIIQQENQGEAESGP